MKVREIALYVYFIACTLTITSIVIDNDAIFLIAKPVIIPAIYFYYLTKVKKPNLLFSLVLLLNFIGDSIVMLRLNNMLYIMIPYFISYILLLKFVVKDISKIKHNLIDVMRSVGVLAILAILLLVVLDIQSEDGTSLLPPMIVYGIVLCILMTLAAYNHFANKTISAFYMMIACSCALASDVFYVIYNLHFQIPILHYINASLQLITYFFLVKYMITRRSIIRLKAALL